MQPVLFDTSVYITTLRLGDDAALGLRRIAAGAPVWLSSVVKGRLTNDALIAMSASRLGITVVTANARDFKKLAEFRLFQWRVEKPESS